MENLTRMPRENQSSKKYTENEMRVDLILIISYPNFNYKRKKNCALHKIIRERKTAEILSAVLTFSDYKISF